MHEFIIYFSLSFSHNFHLQFVFIFVCFALLISNISVPPPLPTTKPPPLDEQPSKATVVADTSVYEPGHATELLSQSVQSLKIGDTKDDFRAQASKIINSMLESRLSERKHIIKESKYSNGNGTNGTVTGNEINGTNNKNGINVVNGKSLPATINDNNSSSASDRSASPTSPPPAISSKPSINKKSDVIGKISSIPTPPAMPASLNAVPLNVETVQNNTTITDSKPISDKHTNNHNHHINNNNNNNSNNINHNIVGSVQTRFSGAPNKPSVTFAPNQNHHDGQNGVALRSHNNEQTAHARDRRSYADQSKGGGYTIQTKAANEQNHVLAQQQANAIAAQLKDGKLPSCCICNVRIDR